MAHPSARSGSEGLALSEMQRVAYVMFTENRLGTGDTIVYTEDGSFHRLRSSGGKNFGFLRHLSSPLLSYRGSR